MLRSTPEGTETECSVTCSSLKLKQGTEPGASGSLAVGWGKITPWKTVVVYVLAHVCVYVYMHPCVCICPRVYLCMCISMCLSVSIHLCMCLCLYVYECIQVMCPCVCVSICVCVHVCVCVCPHMWHVRMRAYVHVYPCTNQYQSPD